MKNIMEICHWLVRPENSMEETDNACQEQVTPRWVPSLVKVTFWYCLALTLTFLLSNLH